MSGPQWENGRGVRERICVRGDLVLETPAHFGNGDSDSLTDISLLRDSVDREKPLLTGASIAGALRNYLREFEAGYGAPGGNETSDRSPGDLMAERLFGYLRREQEGDQPAASYESRLMVDDSLGEPSPHGPPTEIRDGVTIDPATRTAEEKKKYDLELLAAGARFPVRFELWLPHGAEGDKLLRGFAAALRGLEEGHIGLGMRKRRGLGQCRIDGWQVWRYPMNDVQGITGWLFHQEQADRAKSGHQIVPLLGVDKVGDHAGQAFVIEAGFSLNRSLLIRSPGADPQDPDMVSLASGRPGHDEPAPVVSGTSLAGALRGRAYRIVHTLTGDADQAWRFVEEIFGRRLRPGEDGTADDRKPTGSRLLVDESVIETPAQDRVQSRVKLDRFTGGAYPQALFGEQPVFARAEDGTHLQLRLTLRRRHDQSEAAFHGEIGLLLLLLKDLWTGDLPLGGESAVGRGRLQGKMAELRLDSQVWRLTQENGELAFSTGEPDKLEVFVRELQTRLQEIRRD